MGLFETTMPVTVKTSPTVYMRVRVTAAETLSAPAFEQAINGAASSFLGLLGAGQCGIQVLSNDGPEGIVSVKQEGFEKFHAALSIAGIAVLHRSDFLSVLASPPGLERLCPVA